MKWEYCILGVLIVTASLVNLVWIRQDTRPQPFTDPYPIETLQFIDSLQEQGIAQLPWLIARMSYGGRPPLYQLLTVPFIYLFGRTADAMLIVNTLCLVMLTVSTYGIGTLTKDGKAGLLAALLVSTYPPIVNLSKIARPQSVAPAFVALSVWLFLLLLRTRSERIAWLFGVSLGLGFWIHPTTIYMLLLPVVAFGLYMVFFQNEPKRPQALAQIPRWALTKLRDRFVLRGLLPAGLIALGLVAIWYVPNIARASQLQKSLADYWAGITLGFEDIPPSFWWYARTTPGAISFFFAAMLAASLVSAGLRPKRYTVVLVVLLLLMYAGESLRRGLLAWMYFASVLSVVAALTAVLVIDLCDLAWPGKTVPASTKPKAALPPQLRADARSIWKPFCVVLLLLCIGMAGLNFSVATWGIPTNGLSLARALGAPLDRACERRMIVAFCPNPPRNEDWQISDILRIVLDDPDCGEQKCSLALVTDRPEDFSISSFQFCLVRDSPESDLRIEHVRLRSSCSSHLNWLTSDYLIYVPQLESSEYANALVSFLEDPPDVFDDAHHKVARFSLPGEWEAKVIKRTMPLTLKEARTSVHTLEIEPDLKNQLLDRIGDLSLDE